MSMLQWRNEVYTYDCKRNPGYGFVGRGNLIWQQASLSRFSMTLE